MDDMRQKLLPVFLQEVKDKLPIIVSFLEARVSKGCEISALDAAFRSIHTIKGTSGLLGADSVRKIALRIEDILEKHLLRKSCPTQAEYDALTLSLTKMETLIDCFRLEQAEPSDLLTDAMQALDLVEAFPGNPSAMEAQAGLPVEDPFAEDYVFDYENVGNVEESSPVAMTAERPYERDSVSVVESQTIPEDLFDEDRRYGLLNSLCPSNPEDLSIVEHSVESPDLFAEDPDFEPSSPQVPDALSVSIPDLGISQATPRESKPAQNYSCCCFQLAGKNYSLPIEHMVEISDLPTVVALPLSPAYIHGMVNVRGKVLPVVDIAGCDGGTPSPSAAVRNMVIVETHGEQFAFLCDGVPSLESDSSGEVIDPVAFKSRYRIGST